MLRNLPALKLATGSRNPYPIEELIASRACLYYLTHFFSCCSVLSKICQVSKCRVIFTGDGFAQPLPFTAQELTAGMTCLYYLMHFFSCIPVLSKICSAQMPRYLNMQ